MRSFLLGKFSKDSFWTQTLTDAGSPNPDPQFAWQLVKKYQSEKPGMFKLLQQLKQNYTLSVISDVSREIFEYKKTTFGLNNYFVDFVTSFDVGITKPDQDVFQKAIDRLKVTANKCLFIDDTQANVTGSITFGMTGIVYKNTHQLKQNLKAIGLKI